MQFIVQTVLCSINRLMTSMSADACLVAGADMYDLHFMQLLRAQDATAFARMVRDHQAALKRFVRTLINERLIDDVLQETWLAAWRGLPGFQGKAKLGTWLFTVARNEAIRQLRKQGKQTVAQAAETEDEDAWFDQQFDASGSWLMGQATWNAETPESLLQAENLKVCIDRIISAMPPQQRQVLQLRELEQVELGEIGKIIDLNDSHVRVLLHRARLKLFATINHYMKTGECC